MRSIIMPLQCLNWLMLQRAACFFFLCVFLLVFFWKSHPSSHTSKQHLTFSKAANHWMHTRQTKLQLEQKFEPFCAKMHKTIQKQTLPFFYLYSIYLARVVREVAHKQNDFSLLELNTRLRHRN